MRNSQILRSSAAALALALSLTACSSGADTSPAMETVAQETTPAEESHNHHNRDVIPDQSHDTGPSPESAVPGERLENSPTEATGYSDVAQRMLEQEFVPEDHIPRVLAGDVPVESDQLFAASEVEMYVIENEDTLIAITPDGFVEDVTVDNLVAYGQDWRSNDE